MLLVSAMHKALAKRVAICQSSAQSARTLMHLLGNCVVAGDACQRTSNSKLDVVRQSFLMRKHTTQRRLLTLDVVASESNELAK
jgi:hypothetical protein